jgi:Tfp pilus assembly protein PilF
LSAQLKSKRDRIFRVILVVVSPLFFVVALEALLRLSNWVPSTDPLLRVEHAGGHYVITNPRFSERFFSRASAPALSPLMIPLNKTEGVPRVVVLGESAALGYPTPEFNLARVMEVAWQIRHPDQPVEMINLTMAGINSHVLRQLMIASMKLKPDVFVVYAGHNEAIGPFGPAAVFGRRYESMTMIRMLMRVKTWRVARLLESVMKQIGGMTGGKPELWYGLSEFKQARLSFGDQALDVMERHFRENLEDLAAMAKQAGAGIVLSVPSVNVSDWPPLGSSPEVVDDDTAFHCWKQGRLSDLTSAGQVYRIAQKVELSGDIRGALELYRRALDLDEYRFRADSRIRSVVAGVAEAKRAKNVTLADVDAAMHDPAEPLRDQEYFYEHVHLTFRGMVAAALSIVEAMEGMIPHAAENTVATKSEEEVVAALASGLLYTGWDELEAWNAIQQLLQSPVFSDQPEFESRMQVMDDRIKQRQTNAPHAWSVDKINTLYNAAADRRPGDNILHLVAGKRFMDASRYDLAQPALQRALNINPYSTSARIQLARLNLKTGQLGLAEGHLMNAEAMRPEEVELAGLFGELYARKGEFLRARTYLERAVHLRPTDLGSRVNLAMVYEQLGEMPLAIDAYREISRLDDRQAHIMNNLAWLLATLPGRTPEERREAVLLAEKAVAVEPGQYRYKGTLAVCYEHVMLHDQAVEVGRVAITEAKKAGDWESVRLISGKITRLSANQ